MPEATLIWFLKVISVTCAVVEMLIVFIGIPHHSKNGEKALAGGKSGDGVSGGVVGKLYNFQFVEVGEPSQVGQDSRSTIRSHVMRDYYDKKENRQRPSTLPEVSSAASKKEGALHQTHRFKVHPTRGLQEVKAGRRKSKGTSRTTKRLSHTAAKDSQPKDIQIPMHSSPRASRPQALNSAVFASPDHGCRQIQGATSEYGQWSAAESDIAIGDAQLPPQRETDSRNIAPLERIYSISGSIDPFDTLPILCVPRTQHLLHHGKHLLDILFRALFDHFTM